MIGALIKRDLISGWRRKTQIIQPLAFQTLVILMFPLALGASHQGLSQIAAAVIWILALLSTLLTLEQIFKEDYEDGSLEAYFLCPAPLVQVVLAKSLAHWILTGIPVLLFAPLAALLLHMPQPALPVLILSLLLGTPIFSLMGALGSALVMRLNNGGMLLTVLVMPLMVPLLIFGAGAVTETLLSNSARGHLLLLGAMLVTSLLLLPWATAAAIRTNLE